MCVCVCVCVLESRRGLLLIRFIEDINHISDVVTEFEIHMDINLLKRKRRLLYLKPQFVPRSKHFSSRL